MELTKIQEEVNRELADPAVLQTLVETTFKGLQPATVKKAMVEGMLRGFTFKDFLEKNIYAIPFGQNYSLVTSIDYARKIGMRSGVIGISAPTFNEKDGKIISCTVTVKRKVGNDVGEFSATSYFGEYDTKKNLWASKPRTMIAKVAEVSALRKACPEELSQSYVEEEMVKETAKPVIPAAVNIKAVIIGQLRQLGSDTTNKEQIGDEIRTLTNLEPTGDEAHLKEISSRLAVLISEKTG